MIYLFLQTWAWVLGAFILGLLFGWWLCGRCCCNGDKEASVESKPVEKKPTATAKAAPAKKAKPKAAPKKKAAVNEVVDVEDSWKPLGLTSKPKGKDLDDLKRVKGIGPVIEKTLNGLGIYQFQQVADFTADNISWVDNHISFPGRIQREEWVSQAKKLAAGKETEFSKKVDKGQAGY